MKISIIIVNYNVQHFLQQCLYSVKKAIKNISAEVIVVDNNSIDGSCAMVIKEFPDVKLICNQENVGFSKANNMAILQGKGEYILLLNPDTIVQEDTFIKTIAFMDQHPEAGALGVKMIDGKGKYLPESKRGLPTPLVAFYKIFGISKLFPKSGIFNRYYMGHLDKDKTAQVEILTGAFMLIRKSALDKVGLLDETFFMYGEDIDLSYRIFKEGYKIYYFPETTIIHYKGESTKKGSINYVLMFYNAMIIFARKHYSRYYAGYFSFFIHIGIYLRAFLSMIRNVVSRIFFPLLDAMTIFLGFLLIKMIWQKVSSYDPDYYPSSFLMYGVPSYILIWLLSLFIQGGYDKPYSIIKVIKGISIGAVIILAVYALLPLNLRYSRAIIIFGTCWALIMLILYRLVLHGLKIRGFRLGEFKKRSVIVGNREEAEKVTAFLKQTHIQPEIAGWISPDTKNSDKSALGTINRFEEIIRFYKIDEIIFCAKNLSSQEIISLMLRLTGYHIEYKIAPPESLAIIGSNSIHTSGDLYLVNLDSINKPHNRRIKRIFDLGMSVILLLLWPLLAIFTKRPLKAFRNIFLVLIGNKTWIGYYSDVLSSNLPQIKPGIFYPAQGIYKEKLSEDLKNRLNILYAKDYKVVNDLIIVYRNLLNIDL